MKIYNLNIDTSKPVRQVLNVPAKSSKYGIAVKATADGMRIANPTCQMILNGSAIQPTKTLEDGSFLFEMTSDMVEDKHEVMFHIINMDEINAQGDQSGLQTIFWFKAEDEDKTNLYRVARQLNTLWYMKKPTAPNIEGGYFSDDEPIIFTDDATIGRTVVKKIGKRVQYVWEDLATIPKGTYYTKELDRLFFGGSIGRVADCKVTVVLNKVTNPTPESEVEDKNVVCDTLTIDGKEYVPTTLTIDGVDYVVLAQPIQSSESDLDPDTEPDGNDGV